MPVSPLRPDPITLEVVRNGIFSIAEEMSAVIMRSARSPLLRDAGDFSSALTDNRGRLIAQGKDIPIHLGVMAFTVKEFLKYMSVADCEDGEQFIVNLPEIGGNHLPDVKVIRPVKVEGELIAFAVNLAHWADVGGAVPGSYVPWATEAIQEGLRIPPTRIFRRGKLEPVPAELILSNVRRRDEREGDLYAQIFANEVAAVRIKEVCREHGVSVVQGCFESYLQESETLMRAALREVPQGSYVGEDWLDDDGVEARRHLIRVRIDVGKEGISFDFSGSAEPAKGPLNTTPFVVRSAVYYAVKALIGPGIPANDGCYVPIRVSVPNRSLLNAAAEAPVVGGNHETAYRIVDSIFRALATAMPERVTAGGCTTSGILIFGGRWRDRSYIFYECHAGGEGARAERDGASAVRVHVANTMNTPIEVIEAEYPIEIETAMLREDSGGAGSHRGGMGLTRTYRVTAETVLTTMVERRIVAPWGLFGGGDGEPFRIELQRDGRIEEIPGKATLTLRAGDLVTVHTAGGGGYGTP